MQDHLNTGTVICSNTTLFYWWKYDSLQKMAMATIPWQSVISLTGLARRSFLGSQSQVCLLLARQLFRHTKQMLGWSLCTYWKFLDAFTLRLDNKSSIIEHSTHVSSPKAAKSPKRHFMKRCSSRAWKKGSSSSVEKKCGFWVLRFEVFVKLHYQDLGFISVFLIRIDMTYLYVTSTSERFLTCWTSGCSSMRNGPNLSTYDNSATHSSHIWRSSALTTRLSTCGIIFLQNNNSIMLRIERMSFMTNFHNQSTSMFPLHCERTKAVPLTGESAKINLYIDCHSW